MAGRFRNQRTDLGHEDPVRLSKSRGTTRTAVRSRVDPVAGAPKSRRRGNAAGVDEPSIRQELAAVHHGGRRRRGLARAVRAFPEAALWIGIMPLSHFSI